MQRAKKTCQSAPHVTHVIVAKHVIWYYNSLVWLDSFYVRVSTMTIVHRSLHNASPQYLSSLLRTYTPKRQLRSAYPSIFSPNLVPSLLSPLLVFGILAPLFGTPSLLILDLSTPTPPSNPISKLTCSVLQAFLVPKNTIHALLIHIYNCFTIIYYKTKRGQCSSNITYTNQVFCRQS